MKAAFAEVDDNTETKAQKETTYQEDLRLWKEIPTLN
jgi:hypothetical protein